MPVYAESTAKLKNQLKEQEQKKEQTLEQIDENEASMKKLKKEIEKLDEDISKVESEIEAIQRDIDKTQAELDKITAELEKAIKDKQDHKDTLDERLRVMYMYSGTSALEIIFSARSFSDLISKIDAIRTIAEYDQEVFEKLEAIEREIAAKKEEIEIKKNNLLGMKKDSENKKADLNQIRTKRNNVYAELKRNTKKLEEDLAQLEANQLILKLKSTLLSQPRDKVLTLVAVVVALLKRQMEGIYGQYLEIRVSHRLLDTEPTPY